MRRCASGVMHRTRKSEPVTLTKKTSRSMAAGATCIGRSIATGISSTRRRARPVTGERLGGFLGSARLVGALCRTGPQTDGIILTRARSARQGLNVRHRTSVYLNNRLEQDHRGIKGRIRCMCGFKEHEGADRFCREYDELRNFLLKPIPSQPICFQQPADAVNFCSTPVSRWASCRSHNQKDFRRRGVLQNARDMTEPYAFVLVAFQDWAPDGERYCNGRRRTPGQPRGNCLPPADPKPPVISECRLIHGLLRRKLPVRLRWSARFRLQPKRIDPPTA